MIVIIYKSIWKVADTLSNLMHKVVSNIVLCGNGVRFTSFKTTGIPYIVVARNGSFKIGHNFSMNNGIKGNPIGCYNRCTFFVNRRATLTIGNNVGLSQTAIVCHINITIEDNVKIGGGTKIYDTDFHSLDPNKRAGSEDLLNTSKAAVLIKKNAFIGAYSIILKGATIGENSIIGAGSVVTKSIPDNQIWAGNPAKFIREI